MRQGLVPVGHRGQVILQRQITAALAPAQRLDGDLQILLKVNGINDVPAVHAKAELAGIEGIGCDDLMESRIRRGKGNIAVMRPGILKIIGAAEIVFCAGTANGGELFVPVHEELNLALAPPAAVVDAPGHVGTHIFALAPDSVDDSIVLLVGKRVGSAELGVEVSLVRRYLAVTVINLVVHGDRFFSHIGQGEAGALSEGHGPVAVEGAAGVDADSQGTQLSILIPAHGKEIADRALNRGVLLPIPVHAQDGVAPAPGGREPEMVDDARTCDIGNGESLSRLQNNVRVNFPAPPQVPRCAARIAILQLTYPAFAFLACEVLRADRPGDLLFQF